NDDARTHNEVAANMFYRTMGIGAPEVRLAIRMGRLVVASRFVAGLTPRTPNTAEFRRKACECFAGDAWLANWDTVGLEFNNLVAVSCGNPVRLDAGGSLLYRAMGAPKGPAFGPEVN